MGKRGTLGHLVRELVGQQGKEDITDSHIWYAIRGALDPGLLVSNLAEALRIPAAETEELLAGNGFGDLVAQSKLQNNSDAASDEAGTPYRIAPTASAASPFPEIFSVEFSPPPNHPVGLPKAEHEALTLLVKSLVETAADDAFAALYRAGVRLYHDSFLATDAPLIARYVARHFGDEGPRYLVNSGIGANEQFNHFISRLNNADPRRRLEWIIADSPRHLTALPADATVDNTLFMEFSRSGKTEETVKIHEFTARAAKRIVFANSGPLREIGLRDDNLVLDLPDQVSGRFGRNKTPILLAPMHVAGMDTARYWQRIEQAVAAFDLAAPASLPLLVAQFIYLYQQMNKVNHIYFGCNDELLSTSANEFLQFWNEGVNKGGNDISMSGYFGLLRDSHASIEGILSNHRTKMGIFLFREDLRPRRLPPLTSELIDPIDPEHAGLRFGDDERIMAEANFQRFSELMPTLKIVVHGDPGPDHSAVLGQLWADITFCYSKLANVDPGSNPEVKYVRDRSARLLAESASLTRQQGRRPDAGGGRLPRGPA